MAAITSSLAAVVPAFAVDQKTSIVSARSSVFGRSVSMKAVRLPARRMPFVVKATSPPQVEEDIEAKIKAAQDTCDSGTTGECAAAWDEIEEVSAERAHARDRVKEKGPTDPLEKFCEDNPESDECRTYED